MSNEHESEQPQRSEHIGVGEPVCLTHKDEWDHNRGQRKPASGAANGTAAVASSEPQMQWTPERVQKIARNNPTLWPEAMARELNKHNAAFAADRERRKPLVDALERIKHVTTTPVRSFSGIYDIAVAALAQVKEGK